MKKEMTMNTDINGTRAIRCIAVAVAIGLAGLVAPALRAASPASSAQKTFDSPEKAVRSRWSQAAELPTTCRRCWRSSGPKAKTSSARETPVQDQKSRAAFVRHAREKTDIVKDSADPHRVWVSVGPDAWPYAVPIDEKNGKWKSNSKEGRYEILLRRIGENELDAIDVCRGFVEAQHDYALAKPDETGVHQYAQRIISTPGKQDGLYWKSEPDGTWGGPIGEAVARAIAEGYTTAERAVPRLLLQGPEGSGTGGAARRAGLRGRRVHDRRLRAGRVRPRRTGSPA